MINLPRTIPLSNNDRLTAKKVDNKRVYATGKLDPIGTKSTVNGPRNKPFIERRKKDRRTSNREGYPLESRSGNDRRKGAWLRTPRIDVKA
ncbi:hypothetical protein NBRC116494_36460 [Aurantivibrio plasticivorans]